MTIDLNNEEIRGRQMRSFTRHASQRREWAPHLKACSNCRRLLQRRSFATLIPPKPPASGIAQISSRQLLSVSGPEAAKFLQGIITASVINADGLPRTDAFYAGLLNATGRVVHDIFVYPIQGGILPPVQEDGFLIEADATQMARFAKHVKRYKLRAKVTVRTISDEEASIWHAWDESSLPVLCSSKSMMVLNDPRAPGLGCRVVQLNSKKPEVSLETSTEVAYTIRRYLHGVPEGQDEILREQALPLESNMELMNGVDFHKGCYVGQELTIRTKHRGVVRKRILPCIIYDRDKAPPHSLTYKAECDGPERITADMIPAETSVGRFDKKSRSAGKWLKGVGNIGLGLCRLEIMTDLTLPGEQAAATYNPDDEFVLRWGEEEDQSTVKIKAFVPQWMREGLRAK